MRLYRRAHHAQTLKLANPNHISVVHGLFDRLQRAVVTAVAGNNKMTEVLSQLGSQLEILGPGMDRIQFVISSKFK